MPRYFFDITEGEEATYDEDGLVLSSLVLAQDEAARSLADLARDVIRDHTEGPIPKLEIVVRADHGRVLTLGASFHVTRSEAE
jgi:hypothetical protein